MHKESFIIDCKIIDSKNELYNKIGNNEVLGVDARSENNFYIFTILNSNNSEILRFGLISELGNIEPKLVVIEERKILLVGYNTRVTAYDLEQNKKCFDLNLDNFFVDVLVINKDLLLIINETGVCVIDYIGHKIWSLDTDLIIEYTLQDKILTLLFMNDKKVQLNIEKGRVIGDQNS